MMSTRRAISRFIVSRIVCIGLIVGGAPASVMAQAGAGDLNGDSVLDAADIALMSRLLSGEDLSTLDPPLLPNDLLCDVAPYDPVASVARPDGVVDVADLAVLMARVQAGDTAILQAGPAAPTLDAPSCAANANPCAVTGTATAGVTIVLSVNGGQQPGSTVAAPDGTFQIDAALDDGENRITAIAVEQGLNSDPSNEILVSYSNTLPDGSRTFSGSLPAGTHTVWTRGESPGFSGPYTIGLGNLTIPEDSTLTIQPGVQVLVTGSSDLIVDGELRIQGDPSPDQVVITTASDDGTTCGGSWSYIDIEAGGSATIEFAKIRCASRAILVSGGRIVGNEILPGGDLVLRESIIEEPLSGFFDVISLFGDSTALIENNQITIAGQNAGIVVMGSDHARVLGNTISTTESAWGIIRDGVNGTLEIEGNQLFGSDQGRNGIRIEDASGGLTTIIGNTFDRWRTAIDVDGCPAVLGPEISGNTITNSVDEGIYLTDACPHIWDNDILNGNTGIVLFEDSTPLIDGGNVISGNNVAIRFETEGRFQPALPRPTINGNFIHTNGVNLYFEDFQGSGQDIFIDATGNYWGETTIPDIRGTIVDENAVQIAVDLSDFTDSGGTSFGLSGFTYILANAAHAPPSFAPALGETAQISVDLLSPAQSLTFDLYAESDSVRATPLWSTTLTSLSAGLQSVVWNGRRSDSTLLPDEAYTYIIRAIDEFGTLHLYDPLRPFDNGQCECQLSPFPLPIDHNTYRGDFWAASVDPTRLSRLTGTARVIGAPPGTNPTTWLDRKPIFSGQFHPVVFDGRDSTGVIMDGFVNVVLTTEAMYPNTLIIERTSPVATSGAAGPNVHVRSDPWLVTHSYDQVTHIAFCLDQAANVTLTIHEPGALPGAAVVATLLSDQSMPVADCSQGATPHVVSWLGHTVGGDTNLMQSAVEGAYGFTLQAESQVVPGATSTYRGVVQVNQ